MIVEPGGSATLGRQVVPAAARPATSRRTAFCVKADGGPRANRRPVWGSRPAATPCLAVFAVQPKFGFLRKTSFGRGKWAPLHAPRPYLVSECRVAHAALAVRNGVAAPPQLPPGPCLPKGSHSVFTQNALRPGAVSPATPSRAASGEKTLDIWKSREFQKFPKNRRRLNGPNARGNVEIPEKSGFLSC